MSTKFDNFNLKEVLEEEWNKKTKEEKQEFISKFIESVVLTRDNKGKFIISSLNYRSGYLEQLSKLTELGLNGLDLSQENNGEEFEFTLGGTATEKQFDEYTAQLSKAFEIEVYQMYQDSRDKDIEKRILRKGTKWIRTVFIKKEKSFPTDEDDYRIGFVTRQISAKVSS